MISKKIYLFCKDDISLIENYEKAVNDKTQTWECHHRLESDLGLSADELIEQGKYFNVPASELIFLTKAEHVRLHHTGKDVSEETKKKQRQSHLEEAKGRRHMNNGITRVFPKTQEEIEHYLSLGYHFGRKLNNFINKNIT